MNYETALEVGSKKALFISLGVHLLLAGALFFSVQWKTERATVEVELWNAPAAPPAIRRNPDPQPKPQPQPKKPDIALKPDKKETPPPKEKPKEPEKPAPRENDRWQEEAERESRQNKADAEAKQLADRMREAAITNWLGKIQNKIRSNMIVLPNIVGNPEVKFSVFLLPNGDIIVDKLRLIQSSGNVVLDEAIERAILKSSPLPLPNDMAVFQRDLKLILRPYEN